MDGDAIPGAAPERADGAPLLPLDRFLVSGNAFLVAGCQDVFVMAAAHAHSQIEINYLLSGEVAYLHGGRRARLEPGDLAMFWGAVPHQTVEVAPGTRYVCIYLPLERFLEASLSADLRASVLDGGFVVCDDPGRFDPRTMQRLVDEARERGGDPRVLALSADEVLLLLRRLDVTGWSDRLAGQHPEGRALAGAMPAKVVEMMRFVAANGHRAIAVADVARAAGLHPNYAMTRFRTLLGLTIADYLLRHRMMAAQSLLVSTRKDVTSVAFETGFGSVSQFYRAFRRHFSCTPTEFRRRMRHPGAADAPGGR